MTTSTFSTRPIPAVAEPKRPTRPLYGHYSAPPEKCIVELSAGTGPLTSMRSRLTWATINLTVTEGRDNDSWQIKLEASAAPLGVNRQPAGRHSRGLRDNRLHPVISFAGASTVTDQGARMEVPGFLTIKDKTYSSSLRIRIVERHSERLLFLASARLSLPSTSLGPGSRPLRSFTARYLRLFVAADVS